MMISGHIPIHHVVPEEICPSGHRAYSAACRVSRPREREHSAITAEARAIGLVR
jgi:hypothetical protein